MVTKKITSITTKTGDTGETGIASGGRLSKDELIFEVIGTLDELNSWMGLVVAKISLKKQRRVMQGVQCQLFIISGVLAGSTKVKFNPANLKTIEKQIDGLHQQLADDWHTKFVYPGGTVLGGELDIARTVCRRAERRLVSYHRQVNFPAAILKYLNRLSDYLYMLRCYVNDQVDHQEQYFDSKKQISIGRRR